MMIGPNAAALAQPPSASQDASERERQLLERIRILEQRLSALEARLPAAPAPASGAPPANVAPQTPPPPQTAALATPAPPLSGTGDSVSLPGFASGTTINFLLDGYYGYNFNHPVGRINLLRAFDPLSNNFTLSQAVMSVQRPPDLDHGRRLGFRLDLMFGEATETLSGNPANEPRQSVYRNIYQAYGTYIFPLGKGLTMDFGRIASSLGTEGGFAKDQINYSRAYLFDALPFYHMGFRTSYPITEKMTATWWLVNGINQMEDFNGFKSNWFMLSTSFSKNLNWTANYYFGREARDLVPPPPTNFPPPLPTQPGLSTERIFPKPDGRTHIADTYLSWNVTPKLTLIGEADYVVSRIYENSAPVSLTAGAAYAKYQITPKFALGSRFEYLSDHGFFTSINQALKENTLTATYQPKDGFQVRLEYRRDYSNQPFFLTRFLDLRKKEQNTATLALLWWFGGKQGTW
jgi:Putative beta-barrel porin-2, OmpL-like. bbp2